MSKKKFESLRDEIHDIMVTGAKLYREIEEEELTRTLKYLPREIRRSAHAGLFAFSVITASAETICHGNNRSVSFEYQERFSQESISKIISWAEAHGFRAIYVKCDPQKTRNFSYVKISWVNIIGEEIIPPTVDTWGKLVGYNDHEEFKCWYGRLRQTEEKTPYKKDFVSTYGNLEAALAATPNDL